MESPEHSQVPFLNRRHTRRPRLTRLLDASTAQSIILTGPPGYGKTSLAAEWLEEHPSVAWYRATSGSADLAAFSTGLADVMAPLLPRVGDRLRQRLRVSEPPQDAVRPVAELLADDLTDWPDASWLVIDDYHLVVDSTPVEEFMDWLLMLSPRLRVLATSRRRPAWATARRILYGEITEITADQLAMTTEEAARLLDGHSTEAVRALVAQAEGWPALLGLAALCSSAEIPTERVSDELYRYFADEVFSRQPPEIRRFMLVSSVASAIDARTASDVLGFADAAGIIARLDDEGLLTRGASAQLSFHPLLRAFLRHRLDAESPELARSVCEHLVDDSLAHGRWQEAFDLAIRMDWLARAAEIVGRASADLLAAGQLEMLEKWLSQCGPAVPDCPKALLARAEVLLRTGRVTEAGNLALSLAEDLPHDDSRVSRAWCLAGKAMHLISDEARALEYHKHALNSATTDAERSESLWGAFLAAGELELPEADEYLAKFREQSRNDVDARLRNAIGTALHGHLNGNLVEAIAVVRGTLPLVDYAHDEAAKAHFWIVYAYLECLRGRYASAFEIVGLAERKCEEMRLASPAAYCTAVRALAEIGLRRFADAAKAVDRLSRQARNLEDPWLLTSVAILSIKLDLSSSRSSTPILATIPVEREGVSSSLRGELMALQSLAWASTGDEELAMLARDRARDAREMTRSVEAQFLADFAELLLDTWAADSGETAESAAAALLSRALHEEMLDPAILTLRASPQLLRGLWESSSTRWQLSEIITRANDRHLAVLVGLHVDAASDRMAHLTPREREVLALLCRGLTNRDIARTLVVEESTIKVHLHHVFEKLGVKNRLQAILLAQAEGIDDESR